MNIARSHHNCLEWTSKGINGLSNPLPFPNITSNISISSPNPTIITPKLDYQPVSRWDLLDPCQQLQGNQASSCPLRIFNAKSDQSHIFFRLPPTYDAGKVDQLLLASRVESVPGCGIARSTASTRCHYCPESTS